MDVPAGLRAELVGHVRALVVEHVAEDHPRALGDEVPNMGLAHVPAGPVPVLIGGHSDAALRRAARLGDGWMHGGGDPDDLPRLLARLDELRRHETARAGRPFEVHVISTDAYTVDGVRRLEEQGVTDVIIGFRWPYATGPDTEPLDHKIDNLRRFADTVIAKA
jgi:alkanesulfonate monooxygenase SsuD/methylene tetrahydromethanopterin reductase-like flavin-dependent oxidoreductase (luciferase family)